MNSPFKDILEMSKASQLADILQDEYKIYGVFWNKSSSPTLTRTQDARGATATAGVGTTKAYNEFDTSPLFKDFQEVTDTYGNVFIRIPKMYIKKTDGAGYKLRQISRKTNTKYTVCFGTKVLLLH